MKILFTIIVTIILFKISTYIATFVKDYRENLPSCGSGMVDESLDSYKNCMKSKNKWYIIEDLLNFNLLYLYRDFNN